MYIFWKFRTMSSYFFKYSMYFVQHFLLTFNQSYYSFIWTLFCWTNFDTFPNQYYFLKVLWKSKNLNIMQVSFFHSFYISYNLNSFFFSKSNLINSEWQILGFCIFNLQSFLSDLCIFSLHWNLCVLLKKTQFQVEMGCAVFQWI